MRKPPNSQSSAIFNGTCHVIPQANDDREFLATTGMVGANTSSHVNHEDLLVGITILFCHVGSP